MSAIALLLILSFSMTLSQDLEIPMTRYELNFLIKKLDSSKPYPEFLSVKDSKVGWQQFPDIAWKLKKIDGKNFGNLVPVATKLQVQTGTFRKTTEDSTTASIFENNDAAFVGKCSNGERAVACIVSNTNEALSVKIFGDFKGRSYLEFNAEDDQFYFGGGDDDDVIELVKTKNALVEIIDTSSAGKESMIYSKDFGLPMFTSSYSLRMPHHVSEQLPDGTTGPNAMTVMFQTVIKPGSAMSQTYISMY